VQPAASAPPQFPLDFPAYPVYSRRLSPGRAGKAEGSP
jgi:hypothetical protein